MERRELLKSAVAAGAVARTLGPRPGPLEMPGWSAPDRPIIVEGLSAGAMRLSHLKGMQQGGVDCCVAGGPSDIDSFAGLLRFFDEHRQEVMLAKSVREIRDAHQQGKKSNVFCWQSAETLGLAFNSPLGSPDTPLRAFAEIGLRIVGLCYNVANQFGAGCLEPATPLTRAGRRLVEEIHRLNLVLDVGGHTGEQTSLDALAMSRGVPVICTHTNIKTLNDSARCTSDRVIDAIAGTGGVIGLTAVSDFHVRPRGNTGPVPQATLDQHLDQFEYLKKRVGVDHVGLGPDFVDGMAIPYGGGINKEIMPPDLLGEPWVYVKGFESIAELPNVIRGLKGRGWTDEEVNQAMGGNWLRVYEKVWGL
jgi:membrane dipeptidase